MKRLIFDLDNTLIKWDEEKNIKEISNLIKKHNLNITAEEVSNVIDLLDEKHDLISKQVLLEDLQERDSNITMSFVKDIFKTHNNFYEVNEDVIDTLKYLSRRYELVVLTNYFTKMQSIRMKKSKIYKYFNEVIGNDKVPGKPRKEAFDYAIKPYKKEECIMIGDNFDVDIKPALLYGINAIWLTDKETNFKSIKEIKELKSIL